MKSTLRLASVWLGIALALTRTLAANEPASIAWQHVHVPGATNFTGTGWYRAWVKVPDSYFTKHERNLFEESVGINIRDLAGAHEVWVNGIRIGTGGAFPPNYRSGRDAIHRHKVPVGTLHQGAWNELAIRVYNPSATGGFLGEAPFIMDYFTESVFEGEWEFRAGDDYKPGPAVTNKPAAATFEKMRESNRVLGRAQQVHGPKLSPVESAAKMRPGKDFAVDLLLSEPHVAQPTHFSFDERGRLWVAQYRQYPYPAGLTMLSRDKYYRAHYDKVPPAPPNHDRGADIISIHEDTDGDGIFDKHKVFLDDLNLANAVVRGHGGVWVMHTPYLLFYPDRNNDDVPDGNPEVRLAGFGLEDTHSVANGLVWGPDGWLYGAQGSTTSCRVTRPGIDPTNSPGIYFEGCMVWRYHPDTRAFEIFAEGSGNTFGLDVDAQGRLYSGHNGGNTRGWHYVQGGFYQMQGVDAAKFGPPRNPYAFGELPMMRMTNNPVRFTHFGAIAGGTAMPPQAAGLLLTLDPLHNTVLASERLPRGATFETVDREPACRSEDETFRPLYIANAPDGSMFVSDMCEFYIAHGQHYQNQIDPTSGRIYRLRGKDAMLEKDTNLQRKTTDELIALLSHPNKWHRDTAVRLLGERKDGKAAGKLRKLIKRDAGLGALNALWALHQSAGIDEATALAGLKHTHAPVRMWTARLLGDEWGMQRNLGIGIHERPRALVVAPSQGPSDRATAKVQLLKLETGVLPDKLFKALLAQAVVETNPEVLSQFASTARRLDASEALPLVAAVLGHDEAIDDPYIPLLCWWVFEAHIPSANEEVLALFESQAFWNEPIVFEHILPRLARRYAVDDKRTELLVCAQLFQRSPGAKHSSQLMKGFEEAFRGRAMTGLPDELITAISKSGQAPLVFRVKQGDAAAVAEALKVIQDPKAKDDERLVLTRAFSEVHEPAAVPVLLVIASSSVPDTLRKNAFTALSSYDDENIAVKTIELLPALSSELQTAAFTLLASRASWSVRLLDAVQSGKAKRAAVPEEIAIRLRASKDKHVSDLATRLLPKPESIGAEFEKRIDEINTVLKRAPGNPYAGEAAFTQRCAACHKLFFKGGNIGPDLTSYQRDNLGTMLLSIVNPNAEIREGFQYYTVETKDERTLSGFFVDRDNQITVLRGLDGENITLRSSEIVELQPTGRSLMPEGLLDGMTEQDLRDFFAYLRISQPITK
jgi:putative membrane-bound dehydrogenase-like protein